MAAATQTNTLKFSFWADGLPSLNVQKDLSNDGKFSYWVDGLSYSPIYPNDNNGGFFLFFPV